MIEGWMLVVVLMTAEPPQLIHPLAETYDTRHKCIDARETLRENMTADSVSAYSMVCVALSREGE